MFDNQDALPACADVEVDTHMYRVTCTLTDGTTAADLSIMAGSIAHAAFLAGIAVMAEALRTVEDPQQGELFMHNISRHMNTSAQLVV